MGVGDEEVIQLSRSLGSCVFNIKKGGRAYKMLVQSRSALFHRYDREKEKSLRRYVNGGAAENALAAD